MKKVILLAALTAFTTNAMAYRHAEHRQTHNKYYVGVNTGASFVTNQSFDHYDSDTPYWHDLREESSARGYNGGVMFGYNFYCDCNMMLGAELSFNMYSNRGRYTDNFYNPDNSKHSNFEFSHDMEYSWHLTLRPSFIITPCTLFYMNLGVGYAKVNFKAENKIYANADPYPNRFSSDETKYGFTLGAGLQKRITNCISVFAEYQYTYYGDFCPDKVKQGGTMVPVEQPEGTFTNRGAVIDTNVFKIGMMYTF